MHDGPGRERQMHLILENERNEASRLRAPRSKEQRGEQCASARSVVGGRIAPSGVSQWNDDFHHIVHVLLTGEADGYYVELRAWTAHAWAACLRKGSPIKASCR